MKIKKIFTAISLLALIVFGCREDDLGLPGEILPPGKAGRMISLTTERADAMVSLAVDALPADRAGVWIDLDGDGIRAEDGSEDISLFNAYQDYPLSGSKHTVAVHGNLTYFAAAGNELTALNIAKCPSLETLNVRLNRLTSLDLSKNNALVRLDCSSNGLSSLDVSKNELLVSLWACDNQLTELDVSTNIALAYLDCSANKLSTLDVTQNGELARLLCHNNRIPSLDLSQNEKINRLWAFNNPFSPEEEESLATSLRQVSQDDLWISVAPAIANEHDQ